MKQVTTHSFDAYLLEHQGAQHIRARVAAIGKKEGRVYVQTEDHQEHVYELIAFAAGINAPAIKFLDDVVSAYSHLGNTKRISLRPAFWDGQALFRQLHARLSTQPPAP